MRFFYRFLLTSLFFLTFFTLRSQETDLLKTFINKNNFAIRSVQKQCILNQQHFNSVEIKELLTYQLVSVTLFESDKENCKSSAYDLRKKCLDFISKVDPKQLTYYKFNAKELDYFSNNSQLKNIDSFLSKTERERIDNCDIKNPQLFSNFKLNIN
jgi:hypothetical protein